jgi:hypothetical protein
MTVTWTSGYDISEAYPFVEWGAKGSPYARAPADTVTFGRERLCGMHTLDQHIRKYLTLVLLQGAVIR